MHSKLKYILLLLLCLAAILPAREYTPEEKLSQMFMLGFKGTTPPQFNDFVSGNRWGGYILYSQDNRGNLLNISSEPQVKSLLAAIKGPLNDTRIKPLLAIDMEGGKFQIARKRGDDFQFFSQPQKMALATRAEKETWAMGIATYTKSLGFNLNLAPVVDVDKSPYANTRTFSGDPNSVIGNSLIFLDKHKLAQIPCTLKHFPGRGSGLQKDIDDQYSRATDLAPFKELVNQKIVGLVMISAKVFPQIDPFTPAYKSKKVLDLLRSLGYQKIAITDDVSSLVSSNISVAQLETEIVAIIDAGNDLILFTNSGKDYDPLLSLKLQKAIKNILKNNLISEERLEQSFRRILDLKQEYGIEPKEIYLNYAI